MCGLNDQIYFNILMQGYKEYAFALRENQRVSNEMNSKSREKAKKLWGL